MESEKNVDKKLDSLSEKRLLLLGGLGFIGRWITKVASHYGAKITILDRNSQIDKELAAKVIQEDILSSNIIDKLIENSDVVIHLAGSLGTENTFSDLLFTAKNNILTTARIIESCLKIRRRAVYPTVGNNWLNPYTITKRCSADMGIMANLECNGDFRVLKIMNAYGPWQAYNSTRKIIPTFFRQCILREPIDIYGDGNQCIDLIFAQDVAIAFLLAIVEDDIPTDKYIEVGTSIPYRVLEVANMVRELTDSESPIRLLGKRRGEPMHSITLAKDDTLKKTTGFTPQVTLENGLSMTFKWYLANLSFLKINSHS